AEQQADDDDRYQRAAADLESSSESAAAAGVLDILTAAKIVPTHVASLTISDNTLHGPSAELVDRSRPARFQKARQRAIGEDGASGLTARAVVRFVFGVDDALHGRAANRTRLSEFAVHRHLRTERGHPRRKVLAGFGAQANRPLVEDRACSAVQPGDLLGRKLLRQYERRQLRTVQDLVGVSVADAAEQPRIGERALERVILAQQTLTERGQSGAGDVEPAHLEHPDRRLALHDMQRSALPGAGLGEGDGTGRKVESGQR